VPELGVGGVNSFYLKFDDNSSNAALGTDSSGLSNTFTVNNLSVASGSDNDSLIDTPTNYTPDSGNAGGNYATFNPLDSHSQWTLSNGNLEITKSTSGGDRGCFLTLGPTSGKFYWEVAFTALASENYIGLAKKGRISVTTDIYSGGTDAYMYRNNGNKHGQGNASGGESYGASWTTNDVIGVAVDWDAGSITFYKNGSTQGTAWTGQDFSEYMPAVYANTNQSPAAVLNTGARPFAYTPPTGYVSLCTQNLADPTIADGSDHFDTKLYTGNASTQSISLSFGPDLLWLKSRSSTKIHALCDSVRGDGKLLYSNSTLAEQDIGASVVDLASSGFNLGYNSGFTAVSHNHNNDSLVAWAWNAGTSTVSNTDGSITSNVRVNQSAGFSVVSWDGTSANATVGHGLNAAPEFIITKVRGMTSNWYCYHTGLTDATKYIWLNSTNAEGTQTAAWNSTDPTSSVIHVGGEAEVNRNGYNTIAYCFAPVEGYSAFGSYTANGSANGPFVYTGFRPRWALLKESSSSGELWVIYDSERNTSNVMGKQLYPSSNAAEADASADTHARIDFLSNGFKIRGSHSSTNTNGETIIYAAFAEHPFKTSRAR
jgi:hypothetical protein